MINSKLAASLITCLFILFSFLLCFAQDPPPAPRQNLIVTSGPEFLPFPDWTAFGSVQGNFKGRFPGMPAVSDLTITNGGLSMINHSFRVALGINHRLDIEYVDPPTISERGLEAIAETIYHSAESHGGKLVTIGEVEKGSCKGQQIILNVDGQSGPQTGLFEARLFGSRRRLYSVFYQADTDTSTTRAEADFFLDSFEILGGCEPLEISKPESVSSTTVVGILEGTPDASTGWRTISRSSDGFSILVPAVVRHETRQQQVKPFPITAQRFTSESEGTVFVITIFGVYPNGMFSQPFERETLLDQQVKGLQNSLIPQRVKMTFVRNLTFEGFPGREYTTASETDTRVGRVQLIATPSRLFIFAANTIKTESPTKYFDRFFDSIKIVPDKDK